MTDITLIIKGILYLIIGGLTIFVTVFLRGKMSTQAYNNLCTCIYYGVHAAEQLFYSNQGKEKYEYVLDYLRSKGYNVDNESLEMEFKTLIEAAVKELRIEQGQTIHDGEQEVPDDE